MQLSLICVIVLHCIFHQVLAKAFRPQRYLSSIFGRLNRRAFSSFGRRADIAPECSATFDRYIYSYDGEPTDPCYFYECVNKIYVRKQCPNGRKTTQNFRNKWDWGEGQNEYPCTVISGPADKCSLSMSEKGLGDKNGKICPIDLVVAIDISCSIAEENKEKIKSFVKHALAMLTVGSKYSQVGIISYAGPVYNVASLNSFISKGKLLRTVSHLNIDIKDTDCGTSTWLALKDAREKQFTEANGDRSDKQNVMIVITDGYTNPDSMHEETIREARLNHEAGIKTVVVALPVTSEQGLSSLEEWMEIATGDRGENIFFMKSYDILKTKTSDIIKHTCQLAQNK